MHPIPPSSQALATAITRAASRQTDMTIRLLVDRDRVADAYRAYGYFRWVDDCVDEDKCTAPDKIAFIQRQQSLLEACYRGEFPARLCAEEQILADLVRHDTEPRSGLQAYLRNMMDVMLFDAQRRGRTISQAELAEYTRKLATAVMEALHYFIGHDAPAPAHEARYLAVAGAHVVHMLRDAVADSRNGYFNVSREYLQAQGLSPLDLDSPAYHEWVRRRVDLVRAYFQAGRAYLAQVPNVRCRLASLAYVARFEWMLRMIERDRYRLRPEYPERKSLRAAVWMAWSTLASTLAFPRPRTRPHAAAITPRRIEPR